MMFKLRDAPDASMASPLLSLHAKPTPAEDLLVHPAQGELNKLIPPKDNIDMSKVFFEPELFMSLYSG